MQENTTRRNCNTVKTPFMFFTIWSSLTIGTFADSPASGFPHRDSWTHVILIVKQFVNTGAIINKRKLTNKHLPTIRVNIFLCTCCKTTWFSSHQNSTTNSIFFSFLQVCVSLTRDTLQRTRGRARHPSIKGAQHGVVTEWNKLLRCLRIHLKGRDQISKQTLTDLNSDWVTRAPTLTTQATHQ